MFEYDLLLTSLSFFELSLLIAEISVELFLSSTESLLLPRFSNTLRSSLSLGTEFWSSFEVLFVKNSWILLSFCFKSLWSVFSEFNISFSSEP